jgi:oligopeptide/dipeptide ABC transporter ATP-binding protein
VTTLLNIQHLTTQLPTARGLLTAVDDVSFTLEAGEIFGVVGESGSGKSMTCRTILRLVPRPGRVVGGQVLYQGRDLNALSSADMQKIRGKEISMIFQDPMVALNPVLRVGTQLQETLLEHLVVDSNAAAQKRAAELMRLVGIPAPERRLRDYPHEFSGGMCQRVVIAIALACQPRIILADEPTTALDVTIQDQILKLLTSLQKEFQLSLVLVTHNLGIVAQTCQRVAVMYAGQIVELAETRELFRVPRHPYTVGLLNCVPRLNDDDQARRLTPIPGAPPDLVSPPSGCRFHPRCPLASEECKSGNFPLREVKPGHFSACIKTNLLEQSTDIWPLEVVAS